MFASTSEVMPYVAGIMAAASVKLLDDVVDTPPPADPLGFTLFTARAVYCALALCLGALAEWTVACPLFAASYATGMVLKPGKDGRQAIIQLLESIFIVSVVSAATCGPTAIAALALVAAVQLVDDVMDAREDASQGRSSLAKKLGKVECLFLGAALATGSFYICHKVSLAGAVGALIVWGAERLYKSHAKAGGGTAC